MSTMIILVYHPWLIQSSLVTWFTGSWNPTFNTKSWYITELTPARSSHCSVNIHFVPLIVTVTGRYLVSALNPLMVVTLGLQSQWFIVELVTK